MLAGPPGTWWEPEVTVDADLVIIPEVVVQHESAPADLALRAPFDRAWNAGGWPCSPFYNKDAGKRQEPR